jgi:alpha-N-arabinofuranosidase
VRRDRLAPPPPDDGASARADAAWRPGLLRRRGVLAASCLAVGAGALLGRASCSEEAAFRPVEATHAFEVDVDPAPGAAVNRRILGSNVGWAFGGDDLLTKDGAFAPAMLERVRALAPTVLRYPGGTYSDVFRWEAATNEHVFSRQVQPTLMDTRRFLELCDLVGAQPLITVNVVTGTPEEAARWVAFTNRGKTVSRLTGRPLPRVRYWEIGNEPYLKEQSRDDIDLRPDEYARRADRFIAAMRAVDGGILIGLPLTSDTRSGLPVTPHPGFTRTVLARVDERFDYASLHNAYMPFAFKAGESRENLYWGAMAGALTTQADLAAMTRLLAQLRPGQDLPLAITEYSPIFGLGRGAIDKLIVSPAGALYLADVLRVFAQTPNLLLANHWSLSANWIFGAIRADGLPRPAYEVLKLAGEAIQGRLLTARVRASTQRVRAVGQVGAVDALPLVEALATRSDASGASGAEIRVMLINKDPRRRGVGRLRVGATDVAGARMSLLSSTDPMESTDRPGILTRTESTLPGGPEIAVDLPPCSVALLTLAGTRS